VIHLLTHARLLSQIGANRLQNSTDEQHTFKVYFSTKDSPTIGRFIIGSDHSDFDVTKITINGEEQMCFDKNTQKLKWPLASVTETTTIRIPTNESSFIKPLLVESSTERTQSTSTARATKKPHKTATTTTRRTFPSNQGSNERSDNIFQLKKSIISNTQTSGIKHSMTIL